MTSLIRVSAAILTAVAAFHGAGDVTAGPPARFRYQARLVDSAGLPLAGAHTLTLGVWQGGTAGTANSGTKLYEESATVAADAGVVSASVGAGAPTFGTLTATAFQAAAGDLFVQVAVDGAANVVLPRTRLDSVPFALSSAGGDPRTPINPTTATLPIVITTPGSYYLTGDVTGSGTISGIQAAIMILSYQGGVTLDLNGFAIRGNGTSAEARGIYADSGDLTIRNGKLSGWGTALELNGTRYAVTDIMVNGGLRSGINMSGTGSVSRCLVSGLDSNGLTGGPLQMYGIRVGTGSSVSDCQVAGLRQNSSLIEVLGIVAAEGSSVSGCVVSDLDNGNSSYTLGGISVLSNSKVSGCAVSGLFSSGGASIDGISMPGDSCLIEGCTVGGLDCGANGNIRGINGGLRHRIVNCMVARNGLSDAATGASAIGISTGSDSQVVNCTASGQSTATSKINGSGISTGDRCTVRGCDATGNRAGTSPSPSLPSGYGVRVGKNSLVEGCFCGNNTGEAISTTSGFGIILGDGSIASANRLSGNQSAGIRATSTGSPAYAGRNIFRETTTATLASGATLVAGSGAEANVTF